MLNDFVAVNITLLNFHATSKLIQNALDFLFVDSLHRLSHQFTSVAISDGFVVIIFVYVLTEHAPRLTLFFQKWCSCQCNLHSVFVSFQQVGKETALWIIATVGFIDKEDALKAGIVVAVNFDCLLVLLKLLDVDHHDFKFTIAILSNGCIADVVHQLITAFCVADDKPSGGKFVRSLFHQVNAVNDEIEFRNSVMLGKVIRQAFYGVICQGGLSASLCMPYNATFYSFVKRLANGQ